MAFLRGFLLLQSTTKITAANKTRTIATGMMIMMERPKFPQQSGSGGELVEVGSDLVPLSSYPNAKAVKWLQEQTTWVELEL